VRKGAPMAAPPTPVNPLAGARRGRHVAQMDTKDKDREERLAAALRENLRRRKAQARTHEQNEAPKED
ncbi:MAG TPA: hypothetical protein VM711_09870, partial [Sphingomicrobium sp.]|nr:hypothetical protein [Sphingomicrobium sp.]